MTAGAHLAVRCRPAPDPHGQRIRHRRTRPPSPPRAHRSRPASSSTDRSGPCDGELYRPYRTPPTRTIVAPSCAATAKSWLVPMLRWVNSCRPAHSGASRSRTLAQRREPRPGELGVGDGRRHRHERRGSARRRAARPPPGTRPPPPGATPALVSSPATFTCSRQSIVASGSRRLSSCSQADWESTAWMRRTRPTRSRTLRLWTWPMKSHVNRSPNRVLLGGQGVGAVLAHQRDARLAKGGQVGGVHVLRGRQDLDIGPHQLADPGQVGRDDGGVNHAAPPPLPDAR